MLSKMLIKGEHPLHHLECYGHKETRRGKTKPEQGKQKPKVEFIQRASILF
jgi:hypothetical protein